jgi:hypothetical protein
MDTNCILIVLQYDYSPLKELKSLIKRQNIKQWNRFFILVYLENVKKARKIK